MWGLNVREERAVAETRQPDGTVARDPDTESSWPRQAVDLLSAPVPTTSMHELGPDQLEFYVRSAVHQDRRPGDVLVVMHPGKRHKVPRHLFEELERRGFRVREVETLPDRIASVRGIRDALVEISVSGRPLDILVVSGDGSLDHHVLVASYWAFFPELVRYREGELRCDALTENERASLPEEYRQTLFAAPPPLAELQPTEELITRVWLLRNRLEGLLGRRAPLKRLQRRTDLDAADPLLQLAVWSSLFPHRAVLRPHGFDLSGLADASRVETFRGLYPYVRCYSTYPAGTAADNAVFAGVPGWGYSIFAGLLGRFGWLDGLRQRVEGRVVEAFVRYFCEAGVVVPARLSIVGLDGDWQRISSHAAGGPGGGRFFTADLTSKTKGLLGYLKRIPGTVIREGFFGSTIVRVRSLFADGTEKSLTEAQLAEGLYTNRTFLAGVGSLPTTDPTSFAGQSSLVVIPPILSRVPGAPRAINLRGVAAFTEAIVKGLLARLLHVTGMGVGTLAGGGKFLFLQPEHQVAIKEGESIEMSFFTLGGKPKMVPIQVSGDPFQTYRLDIRVAWGPVPLLGQEHSLLLAATRRSLANVRLQQSYRLEGVYIGGQHYFRHHSGRSWDELSSSTGLLRPPLHLPRQLPLAQRRMLTAWQARGAGEFIDTTESGLQQWRRGRYAHNSDQSAQLVMVREANGVLLVRQVRADPEPGGAVYENRTHYRRGGVAYIIVRSQTIAWTAGDDPRLLSETHYFRNALEFQQEAPTFFPVMARSPEQPTLLPRAVNQGDPEAAETPSTKARVSGAAETSEHR